MSAPRVLGYVVQMDDGDYLGLGCERVTDVPEIHYREHRAKSRVHTFGGTIVPLISQADHDAEVARLAAELAEAQEVDYRLMQSAAAARTFKAFAKRAFSQRNATTRRAEAAEADHRKTCQAMGCYEEHEGRINYASGEQLRAAILEREMRIIDADERAEATEARAAALRGALDNIEGETEVLDVYSPEEVMYSMRDLAEQALAADDELAKSALAILDDTEATP